MHITMENRQKKNNLQAIPLHPQWQVWGQEPRIFGKTCTWRVLTDTIEGSSGSLDIVLNHHKMDGCAC
jgi:hypothetical protein